MNIDPALLLTPRQPTRRSGITLTEILISILIMGVGLASLASLFPVGLERLRQGARNSRSALLTGTALSEIGAKNLLSRDSFLAMPWYVPNAAASALNAFDVGYDPWIQDIDPLNTTKGVIGTLGVYRAYGGLGPPPPSGLVPTYKPGVGLPVCYDPLWWAVIYNLDPVNNTPGKLVLASRFGRNMATGSIQAKTGDNGEPSAHGLQRLTNALYVDAAGKVYLDHLNFSPISNVPSTFASIDDPVLQESGELNFVPDASNNPQYISGSPILPQLTISSTAPSVGSMLNDWSFTWMFTGQRADVSNASVYTGDIVVFHNRPFALDRLPTGGIAPAGERVVEAIFGYGGSLRVGLAGGGVLSPSPVMGYSTSSRSVLLRWPSTEDDPDVRVGSWIADVTYEQKSARELRFASVLSNAIPAADEFYPAQRCHWYRVVRRSDVEDENPSTAAPTTGNYRRMLLTVETPLQSKTLLYGPNGANPGYPVFTNVALVCPYVVNVFPKVFYAR